MVEPIAPKPSTRYELVMWAAFAVFYLCLTVFVGCILFMVPLQYAGAALAATCGCFLGAHHARNIHQDNKLHQVAEQPAFFDPRDPSHGGH